MIADLPPRAPAAAREAPSPPRGELTAWLDLACRTIPGATRGALATIDAADPPRLLAAWPPDGGTDPDLLAAGRLARARGGTLVTDTAAEDQAGIVVAVPLANASGARDCFMLRVAGRLEGRQRQVVVQLVEWGAAWLALLLGQGRDGGAGAAAGTDAQLLEAALFGADLEAAAMAVTTLLATRLGCERVALGIVERRGLRLQAVSGLAELDRRSNLARLLEAAMREALEGADTDGPGGDADPGPARAALEHDTGLHARRVVLHASGTAVGVLIVEGQAGSDLADAVAGAERAGRLLGPLLAFRREQRARPRAVRGARALGVTLALALLALLLAAVEVDTRVTAPAVLEGVVQGVVAAPYHGFVATAHARAGDRVEAGQLLALLDDRELRLERGRLEGEREELAGQYRKALAGRELSQATILRTRVAQVESRLELVERHLERTRLVAPFAGLVITGDLDRAIGAPVERGQVLFEVAPLDDYRVVLQVDERDLAEIDVGQRGQLTLAALPGAEIAFSVARISGATRGESGPEFRVEAELHGAHAELRPGMQGTGRIAVGRGSLLNTWSRRSLGWLRLWVWSWWPW